MVDRQTGTARDAASAKAAGHRGVVEDLALRAAKASLTHEAFL
jgi:hypothetical protein